MRYSDALEFIRNEHTNVSKPGLDRISECLGLLKHPETTQNIIHVVGTNGKGSTAMMLTNTLVAAGYHVGTMISPALYDVKDYYRIDGKPITEQQFIGAVETLKSSFRIYDPDPTEFERAVAVALIMFKLEGCDFTILEAGMGGANDATNIGEGCLTVVTKIALDHTNFLGNTLEEITTEKLGIANEGEPIVMAVNSPIVTETAKEWCETHDNQLYFANIFDESFFPEDRAMTAEYQKINIATVMKAVDIIKTMNINGNPVLIDDFAIEAGIRATKLPYRFDFISRKPDIIFDGGHNPDCVDALCRSLQHHSGNQKYYIVTGVLADKDYFAMYEMLQRYAKAFICITPPNKRALPAEELKAFLSEFEKPVEVADSMDALAARMMELHKAGEPILVTGSLYIMSDIESAWTAINALRQDTTK